jgi:hypothetical protein
VLVADFARSQAVNDGPLAEVRCVCLGECDVELEAHGLRWRSWVFRSSTTQHPAGRLHPACAGLYRDSRGVQTESGSTVVGHGREVFDQFVC